jgi:hypothetical protein
LLRLLHDEVNRKQQTKTMQIKDLASLTANTVIEEMVLHVKSVFPPRNPKAPYNLVVTDGTGETRLSVWSTVDLSDYKNQRITVKSSATKKGLDGLVAEYSDYSGKYELKLLKSGQIFSDAELAAGAVKGPAPAVTSRSPVVAPAASPVVQDPREIIGQHAMLMVECIKSATWVQNQLEEALTPEHFQAVASSLFIACDKMGLSKSFAVKGTKKSAPVDEFKQEVGW